MNLLKKISILLLLISSSIIILFRHDDLFKNAIPWHDGSHHYNFCYNLFLDFKEGITENWIELFKVTPELFLPYTLYSFSFFLVPTKYLALPFIFSFCFMLIPLSFYFTLKNDRLEKTFLYLSIFVMNGLFFTKNGGAFDTRIDLISVLVSCISLIFLQNNKFVISFSIFFIAILLKGATFFLLAPIFLIIIFYKFLFEKLRLNFSKPNIFYTFLFLVFLILYLKFIFLSALSYNLMQTSGEGPFGRLFIYIQNFYNYLKISPLYYLKVLFNNTKVFYLFFLSFGCLVYKIYLKRKRFIKEFILSFFIFIYTYILLTSSPLKSEVLVIWFLPSISFFCQILALNFFSFLKYKLTFFLLVILALTSIINLNWKFKYSQDYLTKAANDIRVQSQSLVTRMDNLFRDSKFPKGVVFVNYLSSHAELNHNYDVYTNLIQQKTLISNLQIIGWELSTYSSDWKKEINQFRNKDIIIFVLQEDPLGIPIPNPPNINGASNRKTILSYKQKLPDCFNGIEKTIDIPHLGKREIYILSNSIRCKELIFNE